MGREDGKEARKGEMRKRWELRREEITWGGEDRGSGKENVMMGQGDGDVEEMGNVGKRVEIT